jgi:hypothetical protein
LSEWKSAFTISGDEPVDSREAEAARVKFGAMPFVVLTAHNSALSPGWTRAEVDRIEAITKARRDALAAKSRRGSSVVVQNSSHFIRNDQPDVVIRYVQQIVDAVRRVDR